MAKSPKKQPYPRPTGPVFEDGSYGTVGGWTRDAETKKMRRPIKPRKTVGRKKK